MGECRFARAVRMVQKDSGLALATANLAAGIGRGFPISGGMSQSLFSPRTDAAMMPPMTTKRATGLFFRKLFPRSHVNDGNIRLHQGAAPAVIVTVGSGASSALITLAF